LISATVCGCCRHFAKERTQLVLRAGLDRALLRGGDIEAGGGSAGLGSGSRSDDQHKRDHRDEDGQQETPGAFLVCCQV
jgi:hypothetical protein